jgi:hypothetical protein
VNGDCDCPADVPHVSAERNVEIGRVLNVLPFDVILQGLGSDSLLFVRVREEIFDPCLESSPQAGNALAVYDMREVFYIEGDIIGVTGEEYRGFTKGVRIAGFVKDVRVLACHVGDDDVRLGDLVVDSLDDALGEMLLVNPLAVHLGRLAGRLYSELVDVAEILVEGHQHKDKWFRGSRGHGKGVLFLMASGNASEVGGRTSGQSHP